METTVKQHVLFPNLNGFRFVCAFIILLWHVEDIKIQHGREALKFLVYFEHMNVHAVTAFFVLSGFLITYLLLREKENTATIQLKRFYINRALRIWPLYFFIGISGFFLLPMLDGCFNNHYSSNLREHFWIYFLLYCLFLPITVKSDTIGATWSVRVEELFYLGWPVLLRYFKNYFRLLCWIVVLVIMGRNIIEYFARATHTHLIIVFAHWAQSYRVSCMAIGGIGACLVVKEEKRILSFLYRKEVQWIVYCIMAVLLSLRVHIPFIHFEFYSLLFAFMILNIATNPQSVVNLDYKWMNYLGKISYGIYLYNPITRVLCLELIEHAFKRELQGWQMNALLYVAVIVSTIVMAAVSYEFFEKYFLNLKRRFV